MEQALAVGLMVRSTYDDEPELLAWLPEEAAAIPCASREEKER